MSASLPSCTHQSKERNWLSYLPRRHWAGRGCTKTAAFFIIWQDFEQTRFYGFHGALGLEEYLWSWPSKVGSGFYEICLSLIKCSPHSGRGGYLRLRGTVCVWLLFVSICRYHIISRQIDLDCLSPPTGKIVIPNIALRLYQMNMIRAP